MNLWLNGNALVWLVIGDMLVFIGFGSAFIHSFILTPRPIIISCLFTEKDCFDASLYTVSITCWQPGTQ